jgi:iron-sulfur cluster repair protein YtfE (RIC family)
MELCKASRYVLAGLQKFEAQSLDEEQQPAAEVIKYVLDRYPSERRGDRFYASMKVV